MQKISGFTLFELMISIAIIAILSAIGIPAYQGYLQKAAMTDMLQIMVPYRTAIELCALEQGNTSACQQGQYGIPASRTSRYVSAVTVNQGKITLTGQQTLQGLTVTLQPQLDSSSGILRWQRSCTHSANNSSQVAACEEQFRFDAPEGS
ncbi:MAG: prepilin peptidase-dependent pilin [Enterobacteriaceae bacterium]